MKKVNDYLVIDEFLIDSDLIKGFYTDNQIKFNVDVNVSGFMLNGMLMHINCFDMHIIKRENGSIILSIKDTIDVYYMNFNIDPYKAPIYIGRVKRGDDTYISIQTEEYRPEGLGLV